MFAAMLSPLLSYRRTLPPDLLPNEVRKRVTAKAEEEGLVLLRQLPILREAQTERHLRLSDVLHGVADRLCEGREDLTLGDALDRLEELVPWETWLLDYIEQSVEEEQDPGVPDLLAGHTFRLDIPAGDGLTLPVLVAIATPFTPRKDWLASVNHQFQREFASMVRLRPDSLREAARCATWWMEGLESEAIADRLLTEEGFRERIAADTEVEKDRLYSKETTRRAARVRKLKGRFLACVTKVVAEKSQA